MVRSKATICVGYPKREFWRLQSRVLSVLGGLLFLFGAWTTAQSALQFDVFFSAPNEIETAIVLFCQGNFVNPQIFFKSIDKNQMLIIIEKIIGKKIQIN